MRNHLALAALVLLPAFAAHARDDVAAAVVLREVDVPLVFQDGSHADVRFGRYGIEYWEPVADHVQAGFALGYSGNDARTASRPVEAIDGTFGSLGLRANVPLGKSLSLAGRVDVLYQRDRHTRSDVEFESRLRETRATVGPVVEFDRLTVSLGAAWRELDYREIVTGATSETVRHAEAEDDVGGFATLGLRTDNDGLIAVGYASGHETGWTLRFERTF